MKRGRVLRIRGLLTEDFVNYKLPSMFISTAYCGGKCCTEAGIPLSVCQNDSLRGQLIFNMDDDKIIKEYLNNPITKAIVFGGLEPFEQITEVLEFIDKLRNEHGCDDDVVIYTGYNYDEIAIDVSVLANYKNIIIKYGRFVPGQEKHFDEILGVYLVSDNQYAERIS